MSALGLCNRPHHDGMQLMCTVSSSDGAVASVLPVFVAMMGSTVNMAAAIGTATAILGGSHLGHSMTVLYGMLGHGLQLDTSAGLQPSGHNHDLAWEQALTATTQGPMCVVVDSLGSSFAIVLHP